MFLILSVFTGLVFTIIGFFFSKFPPKQINPFSGYRTGMSMRSKDTWDEAQRYSAKMLIKFGLISVGTGLILYFLFPKDHELISVISTIIALVLGFCTIIFTEAYLKKLFDKDGNYKKE